MNRLGIGYLDTVNNVYPGFPVTPCVAELLPDAANRKQLDTQELVDRYLTRLAERMRTQPAMLGWYVMDERIVTLDLNADWRHINQRLLGLLN